MPFTLAHPAAVLPLRPYCPRWLCFPALVVGSVVPDAAYAVKLDVYSHSWIGSVIFCLPVGMVRWGAFYGLRAPAIRRLRARPRELFLPLCGREPGPAWGIIASLLVGTWTHLIWDSFTHKYGWLTQRVPFLQLPLLSLWGHELRVNHVLWYLSTFGGVVWLYLCYEQWRERQAGEG